ncbi:hypothetical protein QYE76_067535 [Lolium multiflorum]|uniref:Reverse transcriptase domain-containing protein n=1 Tax=Lolium multiflorum TaxID=4521 RepID=A0AAD8WBR7_LOLMU|nr:hypothetical protein QYE76_067535 [Lolium multiflorum]
MDTTFGSVHFIIDSGGFLRLPGSVAPGLEKTTTPSMISVPPLTTVGPPYSFSNNDESVQRNPNSIGSRQERQKRRRDLHYEAIDRAASRLYQYGCDRLSYLDAYSGYNQIKLKEENQELTAFITPHSVYCYNVMTFGLKNTGATYQRCMQACLEEQIGWNIEVYIDDIFVKTRNAVTLIDDLRVTFDNLDHYKIKLNPKKCFFGVPGGQVLGYFILARGIEANPLKIKAVLDMEPPKYLQQV